MQRLSPVTAILAAAAVAVLALATTAQDRAFIVGCQNAGGTPEVCTLKISGR